MRGKNWPGGEYWPKGEGGMKNIYKMRKKCYEGENWPGGKVVKMESKR